MKEIYVVNCCRTAVGSFGGSLKDTPAPELGAVVVKEALSRAGVEPEQVDELMFGCILTAAQGQNPARQVGVKAGLKIEDIDLVEANEAFAAQSVAVARELGFDMSKVNVNGGAISIGHPVGASGARIIVTLLHEMQKRPEAKRGLATLCIGGGMGVATIYEKC